MPSMLRVSIPFRGDWSVNSSHNQMDWDFWFSFLSPFGEIGLSTSGSNICRIPGKSFYPLSGRLVCQRLDLELVRQDWFLGFYPLSGRLVCQLGIQNTFRPVDKEFLSPFGEIGLSTIQGHNEGGVDDRVSIPFRGDWSVNQKIVEILKLSLIWFLSPFGEIGLSTQCTT